MIFTKKDINQIHSNGLTVEQVMSQLQCFEAGIRPINLKDAATIGNGILKLSKKEEDFFLNFYESNKANVSILKFVPASGAATRMFKFLFEFLKGYDPKQESINAYINKNKTPELALFIIGMEKMPFFSEILNAVPADYNQYDVDKKIVVFIKTMLDENKLNYGKLPKGLLPFHKYRRESSTAFKEHLYEAAEYASNNGKAKLHFTISEEHISKFKDELNAIQQQVTEKTNTNFDVSFSYQKQKTNTIAVTPNNDFFREDTNELLFRPSGHGALIENLNDIEEDLIFIKNIDNVVTPELKQDVVVYKKILGGVLLKNQELIFNHLKTLEQIEISETDIISIANFLSNNLNVVINPEFEKYSKKYQIEYLVNKLNRPIRVCGMVKNEGEPGGGPFWVKNENGTISLQIVESAQIDTENKQQKKIQKKATHFNPVDLVCAVKNYKGDTFNLLNFTDPNTGFISSKTRLGKRLKALELPGLWNGAMSNWNTIFIEVPLSTFNPVKNVNDLLKSSHQHN
ncbi:MAG: DUF4301 family protein [Flavobacteriaceae bacterium]